MMRMIVFYNFCNLPDNQIWRKLLIDRIKSQAPKLLGTILLAEEGINGALCGKQEELDALMRLFHQDERFKDMEVRYFDVPKAVYKRLKIKCKKEIINFRCPDYNSEAPKAKHLDPEEWNRLINMPDTMLLDTRNEFEYDMGSFPSAINPKVQRFSHLAEYVKQNKDKLRDKKVAIFCTGGIRCEKLGKYMKQHGIEEVYQLKGGILNYLQKVARQDSLWQGDCFVFDERISVNKDSL